MCDTFRTENVRRVILKIVTQNYNSDESNEEVTPGKVHVKTADGLMV